MVSRYDAVVVGAGPYGLAAVAHLRAAGIETHAFGKAMDFWEQRMPAGMVLRSPWSASHISDPQRIWTLDDFESARQNRLPRPIPLDRFIDYGRWFQSGVIPDLDPRVVQRIAPTPGGFELELEDGETVTSGRVVIATGIGRFPAEPRLFQAIPRSFVSHSSEHSDLRPFGERRVVVVGAGQSALESAVLLHEAGADVEVVARAQRVRWIVRRDALQRSLGPLWHVLYPPTDVGPPGLNWIVAMPNLFRRLPRRLQYPIARRSIRPAGAGWLVPRMNGVRLTTGREIVAASPEGTQLRLTLDDGSERRVDHVLLATGFTIDITRLPFLTPELVAQVRREAGYPMLGPGLESSVKGLHFLGATAAVSFGPLMRFVAGSEFAARSLVSQIRKPLPDDNPLEREPRVAIDPIGLASPEGS